MPISVGHALQRSPQLPIIIPLMASLQWCTDTLDLQCHTGPAPMPWALDHPQKSTLCLI
jgi:hypothetical protein